MYNFTQECEQKLTGDSATRHSSCSRLADIDTKLRIAGLS